jgi:phage shock protein A
LFCPRVMKLINRIKIALRTAVDDLISEEAADQEDPAEAQLSAIRARLEKVRQELAAATVREKRAEKSYRTFLNTANTLNQALDAALLAGQVEPARKQVQQAAEALARAEETYERYLAFAQAADLLRAEIDSLQRQLEALQHHHESLADRESNVVMLERLNKLRREQLRQAAELRTKLEQARERLAVREDHLAAWEDVQQRGLPDEQ